MKKADYLKKADHPFDEGLQTIPRRVLSDTGDTYVMEMDVDDWISLRTHPRQRNIERHSKAPHWEMVRKAKGALAQPVRHVAAAEYKGVLYKVDGHTRAYLWEHELLPRPKSVIATVYRVHSKEEFNKLYNTFDVNTAAENAADQLSGAYRFHKLNLESKRLKHGFLMDAIALALRGTTTRNRKKGWKSIDLYDAVGAFKSALLTLDKINPSANIFFSGVVAAALIGLTIDPKSIAFFRDLNQKHGFKEKGRMDPVEALLQAIEIARSERVYRSDTQEILFRRALRAWEAWRESGNKPRFKNVLRSVDPKPYIEEAKRRLGIQGREDL